MKCGSSAIRGRLLTNSRPPGKFAYAETQGPAAKAELHVDAGTVVKAYEIIRKLGAGGMGAVFRALDTGLGRLVTVTFLVEFRGVAAQRFLAEARANH